MGYHPNLAAARQAMDKVVKSTTYVVVIQAALLLAMVPFFIGLIDHQAAQLTILGVGGVTLALLLQQRRTHLRTYDRLASALEAGATLRKAVHYQQENFGADGSASTGDESNTATR